MQTTFTTIKEEITQADNIIFEGEVENLDQKSVKRYLGLIERSIEQHNISPSFKRKVFNILMEFLQMVIRAEEINQDHSRFHCLIGNYNGQFAIMVSCSLPNTKECQTILSTEYDRKSKRQFYKKDSNTWDIIKLNLFELNWRYGKYLHVNQSESLNGLVEIAFLFG